MPDFDFDAFNHDEVHEEVHQDNGASQVVEPVVAESSEEKTAETSPAAQVSVPETEISTSVEKSSEEVDKW